MENKKESNKNIKLNDKQINSLKWAKHFFKLEDTKKIKKINRKNGHFNCFNKLCRKFNPNENILIMPILPFQLEMDELCSVLG